MKIVILNLLFGTIILMVQFDARERNRLSRRLAALRSWPSVRNRQRGH